MCVDVSPLKKVTVKQKLPMPRTEEHLDRLQGTAVNLLPRGKQANEESQVVHKEFLLFVHSIGSPNFCNIALRRCVFTDPHASM